MKRHDFGAWLEISVVTASILRLHILKNFGIVLSI
jgi:hypothetical protein